MENSKKIILGAIILVLAVGFIIFSTTFEGNPFDLGKAKKEIANYINEKYPSDDYKKYEVLYSYADKKYYATIEGNTSVDTNFIVTYDQKTKEFEDDYATRITNKGNTIERLNSDYNKLLEGIISEKGKAEISKVFVTFEKEQEAGNEFTLDEKFTPNMNKSKRLTTYLEYPVELDKETAVPVLKDTIDFFKNNGETFNYYNFVLYSGKKTIYVNSVTEADLNSADIVSKLTEAEKLTETLNAAEEGSIKEEDIKNKLLYQEVVAADTPETQK